MNPLIWGQIVVEVQTFFSLQLPMQDPEAFKDLMGNKVPPVSPGDQVNVLSFTHGSESGGNRFDLI